MISRSIVGSFAFFSAVFAWPAAQAMEPSADGADAFAAVSEPEPAGERFRVSWSIKGGGALDSNIGGAGIENCGLHCFTFPRGTDVVFFPSASQGYRSVITKRRGSGCAEYSPLCLIQSIQNDIRFEFVVGVHEPLVNASVMNGAPLDGSVHDTKWSMYGPSLYFRTAEGNPTIQRFYTVGYGAGLPYGAERTEIPDEREIGNLQRIEPTGTVYFLVGESAIAYPCEAQYTCVYEYRIADGATRRVGLLKRDQVPPGFGGAFHVSRDGRQLALASWDGVVLVDLETLHETVVFPGHARTAQFSGDGSHLAFAHDDGGVQQISRYALASGNIIPATIGIFGEAGNARSTLTAISYDGSVILFDSIASNLVMGDTDGESNVFVFEADSQLVREVSMNWEGDLAPAWDSSMSDDGRYVVFTTPAPDMVPGYTSNLGAAPYAMIVDRSTRHGAILSIANQQGGGYLNGSHIGSISPDGKMVALESDTTDLPYHGSGDSQLYLTHNPLNEILFSTGMDFR